MTPSSDIGAVIIGRNEGERLRRCFESVAGRVGCVVYVDSGSTDGSVALAGRAGAEAVELDLSRPFTAARARNAGVDRLVALSPSISMIQFIDGDCAVDSEWFDAAVPALTKDSRTAVVCGRRREANPDASVYNHLCDLEWDTPIGETKSCGGDSLMRVEAFKETGGFNPDVIAGEEPELCVRLRARGWRVLRIDQEMTLHDAAMTSFHQWWRRALRAGHAYAEGAAIHGRPPERHCVRDVRSALLWGGILPVVALTAAWSTRGLSLVALLVVYLVQSARIALKESRRRSAADARLYGLFTIVSKVPLCLGVVKYWLSRMSGHKTKIIEYKARGTGSVVQGSKAAG